MAMGDNAETAVLAGGCAWIMQQLLRHPEGVISTRIGFMGGQNDFNVPLLNTEQMYQALRSLGVPTELVIYPDQSHGLKKPSYLIDRYKRYLDWYAKWIKR